MVNIWKKSVGMKKRKIKAMMKNSSELNMSCIWCVVSLGWVLPMLCSSILLILPKQDFFRYSSLPYLDSCQLTILTSDTKFWKAYPLRSS